MAGGLRVSNEVILAKTEVTYQTDPTPVAATNAILVRNPSWAEEGTRQFERAAIRGSIGQLQSLYGGELAKVTFECEMKGSGTAGTAPEIAPLLRACGLGETIVAVTSVTYSPISTAHESITIYYYEGGRKLHIMNGCRGNVAFTQNAGEPMLAQFEFTGHWVQPTDVSQPTPTYNATVPRTALGMSLSINGVSAIIPRSWNFNLNNTIATGPSLASADGYGPVDITVRDVKGSLEIETELDSVLDIDALKVAGTRFAFVAGTLGSVAGNRIALSTPSSSTYIKSTGPGEDAGKRLRTAELAVDDSTPNTELVLAFT